MPIGPTNRPAEPRLQPGQGLAPQRPSGRPGGARSESSQPTPVSGRNTDDRVEQTPSDVQGTDKPITLGGDTREKLKQAAQAKRSNPIKGQLATGPLSRNHDEFRVANVTPNTGASGASSAAMARSIMHMVMSPTRSLPRIASAMDRRLRMMRQRSSCR